MARRAALWRLANTLLARRAALSKRLSVELRNMRDYRTAESTGDSGDAAFGADIDDMSSRLAELEDRELCQIDRVLVRMKQGAYGICEGGSGNCQKKIPVSRLAVLPYTTLCIQCEREIERQPDPQNRWSASAWYRVADAEASRLERPIAEIERDLSAKR